METLKTQVLIIGGGASGLSAALHLTGRDITLIEKGSSNSVISFWNLMVKPKDGLRKKMLGTGDCLNDMELVDVFLKNYERIVRDLRGLGIELKRSNIGLIPGYKFPGKEIRKIFLKKVKKKVSLVKGNVSNFLLDKKGELKGVRARIEDRQVDIFFNYLILAAGGMSGLFRFASGVKSCDGSVLSLCLEKGLEMRELDLFMYHPFFIVDKRLPNVLVSGDILTKMEYEDEEGRGFLPEGIEDALKNNCHHTLFSQMAKEFYQQARKGSIFGKLTCSDEWFERFKKKDKFGFIFKGFKKNEIQRIEFHPVFHFLIGGVAINENAQTSQGNIYAAGEITGGLHGKNRVGGLAIPEALVFGKIAACHINSRIKKSYRKVKVPEKIKSLGRPGLSEEVKKKASRLLTPIARKEELKEFEEFLETKGKLTSKEKLIKKIVILRLK